MESKLCGSPCPAERGDGGLRQREGPRRAAALLETLAFAAAHRQAAGHRCG